MDCKSAFLDYTCCDLVVNLKECEKHEDLIFTPEPSPATPSPTTAEGPQSSDPLEGSSEPKHLLGSSMTLQEALEVRRPQFISRSQERLQKLKHRVQQRKAQQTENLGQKQSPLPVRAHKKQFTIPHPLSGKLQVAQESWIEWGQVSSGLEPSPKAQMMISDDATGMRRPQYPEAFSGSQLILRGYIWACNSAEITRDTNSPF
ncbi:hypothetical protein NN561_004585 [Cricetulus griseus]